ncbi:CTP synthase [Bifidobacterium sp. DSM 109958]|uniref:CTP synthase n=1 Tax=Bifidobacterium moraviense TaxID=2675323 RepID=A0A7Y0HZS2_9BIFI|nr:CTP synthase [Bifidobacterium sp. DSM 109958]NMN01104.1 CTP synthase [Bifidobacterium sp. DSM 109958]
MTSNGPVAALAEQSRRERRCIIPPDESMRRVLCRRVDRGSFVRPWRGLYAEAEHWRSLDPNEQSLHVIRALSAAHPDWTFAGPSAALVHGLDCPYALSGDIYRLVPRHARDTHPRRNRLVAVTPGAGTRTERVDGIMVTSAETTVYDCAARFRPSHALAFADSALRLGRSTISSLTEHGMGRRRDGSWARAMQLLALANGASENGGESRCRGMLHECGADVPQLQVEVPCLTDRRRVHRTDMMWVREDGSHVACEFDGTRKYVDPAMIGTRDIRQVVTEERDRQQCLQQQGIDVFRLFHDQLDRPGTVRRLLSVNRVPTNDIIRRQLGAWS